MSLVGDDIQINFRLFDGDRNDEIVTFTEDFIETTVEEESTEGFFTAADGDVEIDVDVTDNSIIVDFFNNSNETVTVNPVDIELFDLNWVDMPNNIITDFGDLFFSGFDEEFDEILFAFGNNEVFIEFPLFDLEQGEGEGIELELITAVCFLPGTNILTDKGEVAIEELAIGDIVQTADGKLKPVRWIGKQTIKPNRVKNPLRGYPILIKAGALGNGLPVRDLYTSPDHAYLVDGLLINAGALVNDVSIIKTEPTETFYYYHVELENHSLLLAEGTPAESFYPNSDDRQMYDNEKEYDRLYPYGNSQLILYPLDYPRISSKNKVPRYISQKLMQIAGELDRSQVLVTA